MRINVLIWHTLRACHMAYSPSLSKSALVHKIIQQIKKVLKFDAIGMMVKRRHFVF